MALTGEQFTITAGEHEATIVEVGAGLRRYRHADIDVTAGYGTDVLPPMCCGGVLVPWPNRLRGGRYTSDSVEEQVAISEPTAGNAIHGLARWTRWTPLRRDDSSVTLGLDLVPQTGWPFEVRVEVSYSLDAAAGLRVSASAGNHGGTPAPFGAGFHPYLSCGATPLDEVVLTLPAATRLVLDAAQIPVGSQPVQGTPYDLRAGKPLGGLRLDDCFTDLTTAAGRGIAEVRAGEHGARLWFDAAFGYLQAFTRETFPGGGAAVAIEPMSCAPDAFNSRAGLVVLGPGESWHGSWGIAPL